MKSLWVKTIGANGKEQEFVFDTDDYSQLQELMEEHKLSDYKVLDWKLKNITFL